MNRKRPYPNLKTWRDAERIGQREAAAQLGMSQPFYSRLENGLHYPGRKLAKVISERTGVPLEAVLGLE